MWGYIVGYNGDTYDVRELITNNISFVGPEMVEKPWFTAMLMGTWQSTVRSCGALFSSRCCLGDKEPGKACWNALKCSEMLWNDHQVPGRLPNYGQAQFEDFLTRVINQLQDKWDGPPSSTKRHRVLEIGPSAWMFLTSSVLKVNCLWVSLVGPVNLIGLV